MEKNYKKVIISMVVAIIFLVLVIVGATYAYFVSGNTASGTTNLDATTEAIGNVIVQNPTENLYLKLSAYDMQKSKQFSTYYATSTNGSGSSVYASEKENNVFANYKISGGDNDTIYNCTFNLNISKPSQIQYSDMKLELEGANISGNHSINISLLEAQSTYVVEFTSIGNSSGNLVKGDIKFQNAPYDQSHIEGETLEIKMSVSNLNCEVRESICELVNGTPKTEGAKYSCGVSPNVMHTFYLLNNNEDGTSDLIMDRNICEDGTVPEEYKQDKCLVMYNSTGDAAGVGPVTAMTYLNNATSNWENVNNLNLIYDDEGTNFTGFVLDGKARLPYLNEVANSNGTNNYLYEYLSGHEWYGVGDKPANSISGIGGYWTLSSHVQSSMMIRTVGSAGYLSALSANTRTGVRPVITVKL